MMEDVEALRSIYHGSHAEKCRTLPSSGDFD